MFVGGVRSSKLSALLAGTIIFIIVFAGLAWNQMDAIELPNRTQPNQGSGAPSEPLKPDQPSPPSSPSEPVEPVKPVKPVTADSTLRDVWFKVHKPSIKPDAPFYQPFGAFKFEQKHEAHFPEPLGEDLCIIISTTVPLMSPARSLDRL